MLKQNSEELKTIFLLQFTRELIRNSRGGMIFGLKKILRERDEEIKRKVKRVIKTKNEGWFISEKPKTKFRIEMPEQRKRFEIPRQKFRIAQPQLRISEQQFPSQLQDLKPTPTNQAIDLGKLNPLIQDSHVVSIECNGVNSEILVRVPGLKKTNIILNQDEMNQITKKFSEVTQIPVEDGNFKVAFGKLILSATVSGSKCLRFVIQKMIPEQQQIFPQKNFSWSEG